MQNNRHNRIQLLQVRMDVLKNTIKEIACDEKYRNTRAIEDFIMDRLGGLYNLGCLAKMEYRCTSTMFIWITKQNWSSKESVLRTLWKLADKVSFNYIRYMNKA